MPSNAILISSLASAKGLLDSSPITSKVYYRNETPLTPVRTPLKDNNNLSSPSQFATSPLVKQEPSPAQHTRIQNTTQSPTTITGSYFEKITVGRCSAATHQVGRRNRLLSRIHLSISWKEASSQFELTVLGLNGLKVNEKPCTQKETVVLEDESVIDIVGEVVQFKFPSEQDVLSLADDSSDFDIKTSLSPAISVGQDSLEQPPLISNMHSSNALSQKLMAAMVESKEEKQIETIPEAVVENAEPAEVPIVEKVNQITAIKESLEGDQKEEPVEPLHDESVPLETAPVQQDVNEVQVNREGSQDINIEVAESSDAEPAVTEPEQTEPMSADANYAEMIIEALGEYNLKMESCYYLSALFF
jgi:FHA domain